MMKEHVLTLVSEDEYAGDYQKITRRQKQRQGFTGPINVEERVHRSGVDEGIPNRLRSASSGKVKQHNISDLIINK